MTLNSDDIDELEIRLKSLTSDLYDMKPEPLRILRNALDDLELIKLLDGMDVKDYDEILSQYDRRDVPQFTPEAAVPLNNGKIWIREDLRKLDTFLKDPDMDVVTIAELLCRTVGSIESKGASLVHEKVNKYRNNLDLALKTYHYKISYARYNGHVFRKRLAKEFQQPQKVPSSSTLGSSPDIKKQRRS